VLDTNIFVSALLFKNSQPRQALDKARHQGNILIALTGAVDSSLGRNAHHILDIGVEKEACTNNLAPTSSTTCTLVMGDAIAVALSKIKNFQPEDFARFHPGGSLGRKLLTNVKDVMHKHNLPMCSDTVSFKDVIKVISKGRRGVALIMSGDSLKGVITDGDVRRALDKYENPFNLDVVEIMSVNPITINENEKFSRAEKKMHDSKVNMLVVLNEKKQVSGIIQIFDI
jgi:arabinose-5-phosphate isomerase